MSISRFALTLAAAASFAALAGCSGNATPSTQRAAMSGSLSRNSSAQHHHVSYSQRWSRLVSVVPPELRPTASTVAAARRLQSGLRLSRVGSDGSKSIYADEFSGQTYDYAAPNNHNNPPFCTIASQYTNDVNTDAVGNLIVPNGLGTVSIYSPGCSFIGSFTEPFGQPSDAASLNAATGTIAIANIFDTYGPGSVSVCTLSGQINCPTNLSNPAMYEVIGVAMDGAGNCWASAYDPSNAPTLTYFAGCAGPGVAATGYVNAAVGGIDVDGFGHLLAIDPSEGLYVYNGCNPGCGLLYGPLPMIGAADFGHAGKVQAKSEIFVAADYALGQIDVYKLTEGRLAHSYSFDNGLAGSLDVVGAAAYPAANPPPIQPYVIYPVEIVNYWANNPAGTPTDIDLVFNGNVTTALAQSLPLFGIYDAFCPAGNGPCTTGSTSTTFNPTSNTTTFTLSGTNGLSNNSYYTTQSHFAVLYGEENIPSLPCPNAAAEWSFASSPPQPVAWASMNYDGCVPPMSSQHRPIPFNPHLYNWVTYLETSFKPIDSDSPATSGQWFAIATSSKEQPKLTFVNAGAVPIYTANSGIAFAGSATDSPDCYQVSTCPENLNLLATLNYTVYPPPYMKGTKFTKMKYPPAKVIPPLSGGGLIRQQ